MPFDIDRHMLVTSVTDPIQRAQHLNADDWFTALAMGRLAANIADEKRENPYGTVGGLSTEDYYRLRRRGQEQFIDWLYNRFPDRLIVDGSWEGRLGHRSRDMPGYVTPIGWADNFEDVDLKDVVSGSIAQAGDPVSKWGQSQINRGLLPGGRIFEQGQDMWDREGPVADNKLRNWGLGVHPATGLVSGTPDGGWEGLEVPPARQDVGSPLSDESWQRLQDVIKRARRFRPRKVDATAEEVARNMLLGQFVDAKNSSDADTRRLAQLLEATRLRANRPMYYYHGDPHSSGGREVTVSTPMGELQPRLGRPGSTAWEELIHDMDANSWRHYKSDQQNVGPYLSAVLPTGEWDSGLYQAMRDDFDTRFGGDLDAINERWTKDVYDRVQDPTTSARIRDYYTETQLANQLHRIGSDGTSQARGALYALDSHPERGDWVLKPGGPEFLFDDWVNEGRGGRITLPETFNSLLNDRMIGNKDATDRVKSQYPHATKWANEAIKGALDAQEDSKDSA